MIRCKYDYSRISWIIGTLRWLMSSTFLSLHTSRGRSVCWILTRDSYHLPRIIFSHPDATDLKQREYNVWHSRALLFALYFSVINLISPTSQSVQRILVVCFCFCLIFYNIFPLSNAATATLYARLFDSWDFKRICECAAQLFHSSHNPSINQVYLWYSSCMNWRKDNSLLFI